MFTNDFIAIKPAFVFSNYMYVAIIQNGLKKRKLNHQWPDQLSQMNKRLYFWQKLDFINHSESQTDLSQNGWTPRELRKEFKMRCYL